MAHYRQQQLTNPTCHASAGQSDEGRRYEVTKANAMGVLPLARVFRRVSDTQGLCDILQLTMFPADEYISGSSVVVNCIRDRVAIITLAADIDV